MARQDGGGANTVIALNVQRIYDALPMTVMPFCLLTAIPPFY